MNDPQTSYLSKLVIETQMTFEEPNPGNTFTVYRILKVSLTKLSESKERKFHNVWESSITR